MTMLKQVDAAIDARAVIPCPAVGFKIRRVASGCPGCEHYRGLAQMSMTGDDEAELAWHQQYVVRCAHIVERRTQIIEVIEE